jgi:PHS family inorganic phosphate transporter-like MFS transporter
MGFFTEAYDLFVIGVVAILVTSEWHIAGYQKSLLGSLALLTSAAGAIDFGRMADRRFTYHADVIRLGHFCRGCAPGLFPCRMDD